MSTQAATSQLVWRRQLKKIFLDLKAQWIPSGLQGVGLVTDLYDEATYSDRLLEPLASPTTPWFGIDTSEKTVRKVRGKKSIPSEEEASVTVCDVRRLAFSRDSFDYVLSHSTLDHFNDRTDIARAIREIHRVLKPGGILLITLDNPRNPVVLLRNSIPESLLRLFNFVPYGIGKTISSPCLCSLLTREGFQLKHSTYIDHGPRFVTIRLGRFLIRNPEAHNVWSKFLTRTEKLRDLPIAQFTGYFHAAYAEKI